MVTYLLCILVAVSHISMFSVQTCRRVKKTDPIRRREEASGQLRNELSQSSSQSQRAELRENKAHMARSAGPCEPATAAVLEGARGRTHARAHTYKSAPVHLTPRDPATHRCHHDPVPRNTTGITVTVPVMIRLRPADMCPSQPV